MKKAKDNPNTSEDLVVTLASELSALHALDGTDMNPDERGAQELLASQRISAIEKIIGVTEATTTTGAAVQVMLAADTVRIMCESEFAEDELERRLDEVYRLLRSALAALERNEGIDLRLFGVERYAPDYTWPFLSNPPASAASKADATAKAA